MRKRSVPLWVFVVAISLLLLVGTIVGVTSSLYSRVQCMDLAALQEFCAQERDALIYRGAPQWDSSVLQGQWSRMGQRLEREQPIAMDAFGGLFQEPEKGRLLLYTTAPLEDMKQQLQDCEAFSDISNCEIALATCEYALSELYEAQLVLERFLDSAPQYIAEKVQTHLLIPRANRIVLFVREWNGLASVRLSLGMGTLAERLFLVETQLQQVQLRVFDETQLNESEKWLAEQSEVDATLLRTQWEKCVQAMQEYQINYVLCYPNSDWRGYWPFCAQQPQMSTSDKAVFCQVSQDPGVVPGSNVFQIMTEELPAFYRAIFAAADVRIPIYVRLSGMPLVG